MCSSSSAGGRFDCWLFQLSQSSNVTAWLTSSHWSCELCCFLWSYVWWDHDEVHIPGNSIQTQPAVDHIQWYCWSSQSDGMMDFRCLFIVQGVLDPVVKLHCTFSAMNLSMIDKVLDPNQCDGSYTEFSKELVLYHTIILMSYIICFHHSNAVV